MRDKRYHPTLADAQGMDDEAIVDNNLTIECIVASSGFTRCINKRMASEDAPPKRSKNAFIHCLYLIMTSHTSTKKEVN